METLHIEFDIEVEEMITQISGQSPKDLKEELTQRMQQWGKQYLQSLKTGGREDPWLEFLNNIDTYAVDTGIEDFSLRQYENLRNSCRSSKRPLPLPKATFVWFGSPNRAKDRTFRIIFEFPGE